MEKWGNSANWKRIVAISGTGGNQYKGALLNSTTLAFVPIQSMKLNWYHLCLRSRREGLTEQTPCRRSAHGLIHCTKIRPEDSVLGFPEISGCQVSAEVCVWGLSPAIQIASVRHLPAEGCQAMQCVFACSPRGRRVSLKVGSKCWQKCRWRPPTLQAGVGVNTLGCTVYYTVGTGVYLGLIRSRCKARLNGQSCVSGNPSGNEHREEDGKDW